MQTRSDPLKIATRELVRRLDELGRISDEPGRLTRTFLSPAMARANARVGEWMRMTGLQVSVDTVGNLVGRQPRTQRDARTLLIGSHLDTVRNAGRFDGALGVLLPLAALTELRRRGCELPFAVDVLGFCEEESVRFPTAYIGSRAITGQLRAMDLRVRDAGGLALGEVLTAFRGQTFRLPKAAYRSKDLIGYCEVHIEQGPVLENENLSTGVVTAIASQTRGRLEFSGKAGHAGTTPMALRRDAVAGAAEFIVFAEGYAKRRAPLVATVGVVTIPGGATNVIAGHAELTLDVRHASDGRCREAVKALTQAAQRIARRRGLTVRWRETFRHEAARCSPALTAVLAQSVRAIQGRSVTLVSGAGHDAVAMAKITPISMLFVRCRDGLSHHPDEYASPADVEVALRVTVDFLERLAARIR